LTQMNVPTEALDAILKETDHSVIYVQTQSWVLVTVLMTRPTELPSISLVGE